MRECDKMAREFGARFKSPKLLREMGKGSERFYVRFNPEMPVLSVKDIMGTNTR